MSQLRNAAVAVLISFAVASTASAALSPQYTEWRNGPVQWIMTRAEKDAWKQVKSDQDASKFIDLFWARRDPTVGTAENEARDEHTGRAKYADEQFKERENRGSLTERGRAWIVLGPPPEKNEIRAAAAAAGATSGGSSVRTTPDGGISIGGADFTGGREMGHRDIWLWEYDEAVAAFGLPRVEVAFITDPITRRTIRDVYRRDFFAAETAVLRKQIVGDYKDLPEWAAFGGLKPQKLVTIAASPGVAQGTTRQPIRGAGTPVPAGPMAPRGATLLTLSAKIYQLDVHSKSNPLVGTTSTAVFKPSDELGWAAQYCSQSTTEPTIPFMLRITGTTAGGPVDRATPLEDIVPERLQASPGCYMLRGAIPIDDMLPGNYKLHLMIDDPIVKSDSYTLEHEFTIE